MGAGSTAVALRSPSGMSLGTAAGSTCVQLLAGSVKLFGSWVVSASDGGSVNTSILTQMEIQG